MRIETVIDSGAADSVAPISLAEWLPLEPSQGSVRGQSWKSARGQIIPNQGQRQMQVHTEEGSVVNAFNQVGEVDKPLGPVAHVRQGGQGGLQARP